MPVYVYSDGQHKQEQEHGMTQNPTVMCQVCGLTMHRVPQITAVNWNGLPPHLEHYRGKGAQELIDPNRIAERRDDYQKNLSIVRNKKG